MCRSRSKTIELASIHASAEGNEETIRNTALHKIAHALHAEGPNRRTVGGHGPEWRAWAINVGAKPKSSSPTTVNATLLNYDKRRGQEILCQGQTF